MFGMFGPRLNTVFRSRWRALWYVVSVLVGVWFFVPHRGAKNDPDAQKDAEAVVSLLRQQQPAGPDHHVNPWAKTPPPQQQ
jgi:hypothetical protein